MNKNRNNIYLADFNDQSVTVVTRFRSIDHKIVGKFAVTKKNSTLTSFNFYKDSFSIGHVQFIFAADKAISSFNEVTIIGEALQLLHW